MTVENGLSSNTIYKVLQDKRGFIWTCGDAGISRYDGKIFTNYSVKDGIQDNEVLKITEDGEGKIWYLTLKGKVGYVFNGKVNPLNRLNEEFNKQILDVESCPDTTILIITESDYYWISHDQIKHKDTLGFGQINSVYINDLLPGSIIRILHNPTLAGNIIHLAIFNYKIHTNSEKLIGLHQKNNLTSQQRLFPQNSTIYSIDEKLGINILIEDTILSKTSILSTLKISPDELWIGTFNGLYRYHIENKTYKPTHFLGSEKVSSIIRDREGTTFIGTLGNGLFQLNSTQIQTISAKEGLKNKSLTALGVSPWGPLLIGSESGSIYSISKNQKRLLQFEIPNKSPSERITAIVANGPEVFFGTDKKLIGLKRSFKPRSLITEDVILSIKTIYFGKQFLWIGTYSNLVSYDHDRKNRTEIAKGRTTAVFEDSNGSLWFSNPQGLNSLVNGKLRNHTSANPILSERIVHIRQGKNNILWMASQGKGLIYLDPSTNRSGNISTNEGLADDICNSFYIDGDNIWVATNNGVSKITFMGSGLNNYKIQNIGVKQGLASNSVRAIVKWDGYIYAATSNGLCYFNENEVLPNNFPPPVYITGVKLWDRDTTILSEYTFAYEENNIKIDFVGLAYKTMGDIVYKYKMAGIDTTWITTNYGSVNFPSLPPGEYKFLVKAVNEDGVESSKPATVKITIEAPFWQTWWFWSAIVSAFLGSVYLIFRHEVNAVKRENGLLHQIAFAEQKALQAQMNPHFVFNALNSIQRYISDRDSKKAHLYLAKFGKLIRSIFENSTQKKVSVFEEIQTLEIYLELESLRFSEGFDYVVNINPDLDIHHVEIPSMIIQPYVENAIWHGLMHKNGRGLLTVSLNPIKNGITCIVQDNGIGRTKSKKLKDGSTGKHKSSGMHITEERLRLLGVGSSFRSKVKIIDLVDDNGQALGTRVEISLSSIF